MTSDQTLATMNPFTVDAGHVQLDVDAVSYSYNEVDYGFFTDKTTAWSYGAHALRVGLWDRLEASMTLQPHTEVKRENGLPWWWGGGGIKSSGFGNTTAGMKLNLWGNDEGVTALAIAGDYTFATSELFGQDVESWSIKVPFSIRLPWDLRLGIMTGVDVRREDPFWFGDDTYTVVNGISLQGNIIGGLDGYAEFVTYYWWEAEDWTGDVNAGLSYRVTEYFAIHAGCNYGVKDYEFDERTRYNPYLGFSVRL